MRIGGGGDRCRSQISAVLAGLEADRARRAGDYWFGDRIGHADVVVGTVLRFTNKAHPSLISMGASQRYQGVKLACSLLDW